MENDGQQQQAVEVVVTCETWGATAPWGQTTADRIRQPTIEVARRVAAEAAARHRGGCMITVREPEASASLPDRFNFLPGAPGSLSWPLAHCAAW
jgi:hypothetical protein